MLFVVICQLNVNASSEIIGYTINSNGEEGYVYENDLHMSTKTYTDGSDGFLKNDSDCTRTVIGNDNRVKLEDWQYTTSTYRKICQITVTFGGVSIPIHGTGFLVGPHTILTACHIVYQSNSNYDYGWFSTIQITFGSYIDSLTNTHVYPYGIISTFSSASCGNYCTTKDPNDDWAFIELTTDIGNSLGFFGVTSTLFDEDSIWAIGYPDSDLGNMYYGFGQADDVEIYSFAHDCDASEGQSGCPILKSYNGYVCGIHSDDYGYWLFGWHPTNQACKISDYIVGWVEDRQFNIEE